MSARELILLSPYQVPTQSTLYLGDDDVAVFLNGHAALWHPAALAGAAGVPRVASPYDHEQPTAGYIYAVPEHPPLMLPDDWDERVRDAGALSFKATRDRARTLANLLDVLRTLPDANPALLDLPPERIAPFLGIGFGYLHLQALFEAMSHENLLSTPELWQEVRNAVTALGDPDPDAWRRQLRAAAERMQTAREVLYAVTIHIVDLCLLDEARLDAPWPHAFDTGLPVNVLACAALLERLGREHPQRLAALRERVAADHAEVCGGPYLEREDTLLPLESQLWNLLKGQQTYQELLGQEVRVFGRKRFGYHPHLPLLIQNVGISRALLLAFNEAVLPSHRVTVVSWPSLDGRQVEAFTRSPHAADSAQTFFHLTHHLHRTIMQDQAATLALLHRGKPAAPGYEDWVELSRLAPVLGRWTTLSGYFNEVLAGEYASAASADEFHDDYLVERTASAANANLFSEPNGSKRASPPAGGGSGPWRAEPVSGFARHVRARRVLDTTWALIALHRALRGPRDAELEVSLQRLEDRLESETPPPVKELNDAQDQAADALAQRLVARGQEDQPGYLVLNPCSFTRRVVVELPDMALPPVGGHVKAGQLDADGLCRLVVEVPALGFAWVPKQGSGTPAPAKRMRLADDRTVRNEFFEAEIDPATGGLRAIRDHRTRVNRLGQQLVYNPGSSVQVTQVRTTSTGPALGEIVTEGVLRDVQNQPLATFRQRFRAWVGRPVLGLRIEITPVEVADGAVRQPQGYPWHAYYGARFAWREERATLLRGVFGTGHVTSHTHPETPDYLEVRVGRQNTVLFPGGLPFHQRHGGRMLDVILIPEGETTQTFDLAVRMDWDYPMQTALGMVTPAPVVATSKGPPHVGATGWLFHLDAPNLLLTGLRPGPDGVDAVLARMLECGPGGPAELRCVRDPVRAMLLDARGMGLMDLPIDGDRVTLDVARHDLLQVRVDFS
jgi:hypothetical protein